MMSQLKAVTQLTPQAIRYDRLSKRFGVLTIQQSPTCSITSMQKSAATFVTVSLNAEECSDLRDCEFIYTVCNDQSHGASIFDRDQLPDDEAIRRACLAVLNHLQDRYPGQLVASGLRLAASQNE